MNAFEIPALRYSLPAGGAVEPHRFVSVTTGSVAIQATNATAVIGVSRNAVRTNAGVTAAQQVVEIADGICVVEAGGVIAAGALVYSDEAGKATTTQGSSAGSNPAGTALVAAAKAGDLIAVKVCA